MVVLLLYYFGRWKERLNLPSNREHHSYPPNKSIPSFSRRLNRVESVVMVKRYTCMYIHALIIISFWYTFSCSPFRVRRLDRAIENAINVKTERERKVGFQNVL